MWTLGLTGSAAAGPVWHDFMAKAVPARADYRLERPRDVLEMWVQERTGLLVREGRLGARAQLLNGTAKLGQLRRNRAQASDLVAQRGSRRLELRGDGDHSLGGTALQLVELGKLRDDRVETVAGAVHAPMRRRGEQQRHDGEHHGRRAAAARAARSALDGQAFDFG